MATYNGHNEDSNGNILLNIGNGITATVETGSTASQDYTKGTYLFFNNRLCKTSVAVASGESLAIGINLLETNIGAELSSHLRASDGKEFYFDIKDGVYGYYTSSAKVSSDFNVLARKAVKLATQQLENFTVDCTGIVGYHNLTSDNFLIQFEEITLDTINVGVYSQRSIITSHPTLSYDASSGILSVNCPSASIDVPNTYNYTATPKVGVWFIE